MRIIFRCIWMLILPPALAGCNSTVAPGGGPAAGNQGASGGSLSAEQSAEIAVAAARAVAGAVAAIAPIKDLQAIYESGRPQPRCPSLSAEFESSVATITLDYGTGCKPDAFAAARFSGRARGSTKLAYNGINYSFEGFAAGDSALGGAVVGGFTPEGARVKFTVSVNLTPAQDVAVRGSASVYVGSEGRITIAEARLSLAQGDSLRQRVVITDAVIDGANSSGLIPSSGTVELSAGGAANDASTRRMDFTASTPIDGAMISR